MTDLFATSKAEPKVDIAQVHWHFGILGLRNIGARYVMFGDALTKMKCIDDENEVG